MRKAVVAVALSVCIGALAFAQCEIYTVPSDKGILAYKNAEDYKTMLLAAAKEGGLNEALIKQVALDIGQEKAYLLAKGTECVLLETEPFHGGFISTAFVKGKGLLYIVKTDK